MSAATVLKTVRLALRPKKLDLLTFNLSLTFPQCIIFVKGESEVKSEIAQVLWSGA